MTTGTRRKPSEYDFLKGEFDELLLPTSGSLRRSTYPRGGTVRHIDIHHMTVQDSDDGAANRACVQIWKSRPASAHYGVDNLQVAQFVYDNRMAWGNANGKANREGIIVEHANSTIGDSRGWKISETTLATSAKLVAGLHIIHKLGRPTSGGFGTSGTIRTHNSFYPTACPGPYFKSNWSRYVKLVQAAYDKMVKKPTTPTTPPVVTPTTPKPVPEAPVTKLELLHWNIAGSDSVNGYGATNATRGDDVGRYALELGFDVFLTCEASQKPLRAGMNKILGKYHPFMTRSKGIWYDSDDVKQTSAPRAYSAEGYFYLGKKIWGVAFFGSKNGKKFSVIEIHTDHRAPAKQVKQIQTIFKKWRKDTDAMGIKHVNTYVCGDFNTDGSSADNPFKALTAWNFEQKGDSADKAEGTFRDGRRLDGVLGHKEAYVGVRVESRNDGKQNLSDHMPISFTPTLQ